MTTKADIVKRILPGRAGKPAERGYAFAPSNIALCKYWGKRNEELNLPVTSSLSLSLGKLGSEITLTPDKADRVELNGSELPADSEFSRRLFAYLDHFRPTSEFRFRAVARNTIPTAAGFASSASGFAAVVLALNELFGWRLDHRNLSILARLGSGSACRSLFQGFAEWHAGTREDGMDSYAEALPHTWPGLCMGLLVVSSEKKKIGSRAGMKETVATSPLYASWPATVAKDMEELKAAIEKRDFEQLGRTAESNALAMHATMIAGWPSLMYWLPESVLLMKKISCLREDGLPVYFTMDAGPNIKLIFLEKDAKAVKDAFPEVQMVRPFEGATSA